VHSVKRDSQVFRHPLSTQGPKAIRHGLQESIAHLPAVNGLEVDQCRELHRDHTHRAFVGQKMQFVDMQRVGVEAGHPVMENTLQTEKPGPQWQPVFGKGETGAGRTMRHAHADALPCSAARKIAPTRPISSS
jgi:hypothetical protein